MLFEIDKSMFRMVSNTGDIVHPSKWSHGFKYGSIELEPGERFELAKDGFFDYNLASADITHVFIEVAGLSRIDRARWQIEIPH
jgi:hypothetical protein